MLQWRRLSTESGALVAWLDADAQDEPERFTMALLHSLRTDSGRPSDPTAQCTTVPALEAFRPIVGIAMRGTPTVLMIDDAETLPDAAVCSVLQFLLLNAPANLHVVIDTRKRLHLQIAEMAAKGDIAELTSEDLRMRLEESMDVLERRLGPRLHPLPRKTQRDACAGHRTS